MSEIKISVTTVHCKRFGLGLKGTHHRWALTTNFYAWANIVKWRKVTRRDCLVFSLCNLSYRRPKDWL